MKKVEDVAKGVLVADAAKATAKAVMGIAEAAIQVGSTFETSMSQVAATLGITTDEIAAGSESFEMLKAKAKEMGATTKYTASEAAEGLNILAMAGLSAEEACDGIADVMALAGAGAISLEQAATYVTGAVKGFNDEMENASKYTDIMAAGATMANTNVDALGAALSTTAATANAYNQSVEGTSVALLRLAEQNVTGTEAATALNRAMADLYTPTSQAATALKELGVSAYDSSGAARDVNDVVDDLNVALQGMTDEEKLAYESTIFTTFGMKAFQKMTVSTTETVNKFKDGIANASGSAMKQFETQTDNLEGKLAILNSALEATGIAIYETFDETLKEAAEGATDAIDAIHESIENGDLKESFAELSENLGEFLEAALKLGEKALPVLIDGLNLIMNNLMPLLTAFASYKAAMIGMEAATLATTIATEGLTAVMTANPIGLIAAALGFAIPKLMEFANGLKEDTTAVEEFNKKADELSNSAINMARRNEEVLNSTKQQSNYYQSLAAELSKLNSQEKIGTKEKERIKVIVGQLNSAYSDLNLTIDETTGRLADETAGWEESLEAMMKKAKYAAIEEQLTEALKEQAEIEYELWDIDQQYIRAQEKKRDINLKLSNAVQTTIEQDADLYDELQDLTKETDNLTEKQTELQGSHDELQGSIDKLTSFLGNEKEAADGAAEASNNLAESQSELAEATAEVSEEVQKESESLQNSLVAEVTSFDAVTEAAKHSKEELIKNLEDQQAAMEEWAEGMQLLASKGVDDGILAKLADMGLEGQGYLDAFNSMTGDELAQYVAIWEENTAMAMSSGHELAKEYMTAGTDATLAWIDGAWVPIQTGQMEEIPKAAVDTFIGSADWNRMSPEVQAKVRAAIEASKEAATEGEAIANTMVESLMNSPTWETLDTATRERIQKANAGMKEEATAGAEDLYEEGANATTSYAEGMKSKQDEVETAATEIAETAVKAVDDTLESSNGGNSQVGTEDGEGFGGGFAEGMKSKEGEVQNNATSLGRTAMTSLKNNASRSDAYQIGLAIAEGMAAGIRDGQSQVINAARESAQAAIKEAKSSLEINSPSKVFRRIYHSVGEGSAQGIEQSTPLVTNAANQMARACIAQFDDIPNLEIGTTLGDNLANGYENVAAGMETTENIGYNQTVNIYSKAMSADELAREIRLETKYGIREN